MTKLYLTLHLFVNILYLSFNSDDKNGNKHNAIPVAIIYILTSFPAQALETLNDTADFC